MAGSLAVRLGYQAIAKGVRLPRSKRIDAFDQQGRTIDEIKRCGIDVVFDVGANRGYYAKHLRMAGYAGRILSFEPEPGTFADLARMAEGDAKWQVFACALGKERGKIDFNVIKSDGETVLSSAFTPIGERDTRVIQVDVRTVEDIVESERLPESARIFLKMDTQGYDLNVFRGAGNAPNIRLLQSEVSIVPLYVGMPHYTESLHVFEEAGFMLLDLFVVNRTEGGGVLEYDALMRRA